MTLSQLSAFSPIKYLVDLMHVIWVSFGKLDHLLMG